MNLLSKQQAKSQLQKDNEELLDANVRLRKNEKDIQARLINLKGNYEPEKLQKLKEFESFCRDLIAKKGKLLEELSLVEKEIEKKKDIYFGLVTKQDVLDEKTFQLNEKEKKLELREQFIIKSEQELQKKWTK